MLDDLHQLHSEACHDVLDVVTDGIPLGSQFVTTSRVEQPHSARRRTSGQQLEVAAADLALDAAGAQQIFSSLDVTVSPELAAAVARHTEGWPAGLHLAAMIAKDSSDYLGTVTGDDPYVADYLYRECLARQPEDVQWFLCRTAVLGRLCGALTDATLGISEGTKQLRRLEASNLFVVPLDRKRRWYRYHSLFREFLLGELHRRVPDELIEKLHLRAADWYEANGSPMFAVEHLLETTERDRSLQLIASLAMQTYQSGELAVLRRWLSVLGTTDIERYPPLGVIAAWAGLLTGDTIEAERWAAFVESASFDVVPTDGSASFSSARAMLRAALCARGPEAMKCDAAFAVANEPIWGAYRDTALWLLGEAHLLTGNLREAEHLFEDASGTAAGLGHPTSIVISRSEMALLAMDRGDWQEAATHLDVARTVGAENRLEDYAASVLVLPGVARLALHRGDLAGAEHALTQAMRVRPLATYVSPFIAVRLRIELARMHTALFDHGAARHLVREIDDILLRRPSLGVLVERVNELRSRLSATSVVPSGPSPLTAAELRLLPYMQTHLTLGAIAERLYVSRNTVSTQVSSIYRKLGVCSRREAVAEATAIGLIGG
jgi:LuxR family maltose regulon positive regulatory protein